MTKQEKALSLIDNLLSQLSEIVNVSTKTSDYSAGSEKIKRWKERASNKISSEIDSGEGAKLQNKKKMSFKFKDPKGNLIDEALMYSSFLEALKEEIQNYPEIFLEREIATKTVTVKQDQRPIQETINRSVFIVHGHDEQTKETVARFIEKLGLKSIILHEQSNQGKTIIEKLEACTNEVAFAIVLLTPDDKGHEIKKPENIKGRARQNVILELGLFLGVLGRKRVCALYKGDVEIPSDYDGVVYVPLDKSDGWKLKLAREINQVIKIDLNKAL